MARMFRPGDPVIYRATKHSAHPGPRAQEVTAETYGEGYSYVVDKFWVVAETRPDGQVVLKTRRGKTHRLSADDPRLRPARWWERLWFRDRFPSLENRAG
jgi:hypothetical protein